MSLAGIRNPQHERTHAPQQTALSLDRLVGVAGQREQDLKASFSKTDAAYQPTHGLG
jgi:hypothetical protein